MDIEITKDSDYLICSLYKAYLQKRSNGSCYKTFTFSCFLNCFINVHSLSYFLSAA